MLHITNRTSDSARTTECDWSWQTSRKASDQAFKRLICWMRWSFRRSNPAHCDCEFNQNYWIVLVPWQTGIIVLEWALLTWSGTLEGVGQRMCVYYIHMNTTPWNVAAQWSVDLLCIRKFRPSRPETGNVWLLCLVVFSPLREIPLHYFKMGHILLLSSLFASHHSYPELLIESTSEPKTNK